MAVPERTDHLETPQTVGIVGAGQLARMLCEAASALGVATVVLAARGDDAATQVAGDVTIGGANDAVALSSLARRCDVVTFDHELVDLEALSALEGCGVAVRPSSRALRAAVDKAHQRRTFAEAGLPVPRFCILDGDAATDLEALRALADELGEVPVVKAARGGYDGRGVVVADTLDEAAGAVRRWRDGGVAVVAEAPCAFRAELAALVARRPGGETVQWRTVQTDQLDGVCREVRVPGSVDDATARRAAELAGRVAEHLGVVGVLAVELFDTADGLVVNEVATRPHNSGHWTIEGATTSQFENHLRAVLDLPLGATDTVAPAICSVNVFGAPDGAVPGSLAAALAEPSAKVHLYGKAPRPGRKLGHVTVVGTDAADVAARAWRVAAALGTPVAANAGAER
ncbi:MAG TPA: 5-(carboxyamino)imidazole ribonucleotide synthase [Acidimicrobiales bacterium]|nr:5-(carboxyamino)imidazole ribonucleotide synthase [Acidimicrobiales bacterium]